MKGLLSNYWNSHWRFVKNGISTYVLMLFTLAFFNASCWVQHKNTKQIMEGTFNEIWKKDYEVDKEGYRHDNYWYQITVFFNTEGNSKWVAVRLLDIRLVDGATETEEYEREEGMGHLSTTNGKTQVDYIFKKRNGAPTKRTYTIEYPNDNKMMFIGENGHQLIFKK